MAEVEVKAIKGGRLIDGTGAEAIEKATVIIEGSKIKAVGKALEVPRGAKVIDTTGKTVMPAPSFSRYLNPPASIFLFNN